MARATTGAITPTAVRYPRTPTPPTEALWWSDPVQFLFEEVPLSL